MNFYINLFFVYAIFGYIMEEVFMKIINNPYNSGVLYGPWTTVYGIAIYIMLIIYYIIRRLNFSKIKERLLYFFSVMVSLSLLEGLSGYIIEKTRHKIYWNYDHFKFNIGHYMCLEIALVWGILAYISVYFVIPRIKNKLNKIPKIISYIFLFLYIVDTIISNFL